MSKKECTFLRVARPKQKGHDVEAHSAASGKMRTRVVMY